MWPAGLLALVGILGAGAVATQAAPSSEPSVCVPADEAHQVSLSGFTVRPASNGEPPAPIPAPQVCADVDPGDITVSPAPANPDV